MSRYLLAFLLGVFFWIQGYETARQGKIDDNLEAHYKALISEANQRTLQAISGCKE